MHMLPLYCTLLWSWYVPRSLARAYTIVPSLNADGWDKAVPDTQREKIHHISPQQLNSSLTPRLLSLITELGWSSHENETYQIGSDAASSQIPNETLRTKSADICFLERLEATSLQAPEAEVSRHRPPCDKRFAANQHRLIVSSFSRLCSSWKTEIDPKPLRHWFLQNKMGLSYLEMSSLFHGTITTRCRTTPTKEEKKTFTKHFWHFPPKTIHAYQNSKASVTKTDQKVCNYGAK